MLLDFHVDGIDIRFGQCGQIEPVLIHQIIKNSIQCSSLLANLREINVQRILSVADRNRLDRFPVLRNGFKQRNAVKQILPTDDDVSRLLSAADPELKKAVVLSALGTFRRGECCALKYADVSKDHIYVHADFVMDEGRKWIYKEHPKTGHSVRVVLLPAEATAQLGKGDPDSYVVGVMPDAITHRFCRLRKKLGLSFRFHDLRAYAASVMEYLGVPKTYIQSVGGWRPGSMVLEQRYLRPMQDKQKQIVSMTSSYFFENVLSEKNGNESGNEI